MANKKTATNNETSNAAPRRWENKKEIAQFEKNLDRARAIFREEADGVVIITLKRKTKTNLVREGVVMGRNFNKGDILAVVVKQFELDPADILSYMLRNS